RGQRGTLGGRLSVDLEARDHPLVTALSSRRPVFFPTGKAQPWSGADGIAFCAIPLRSGPSPGAVSDGLLLLGEVESRLDADVRWFAEVLGRQVARLRHRQVLDQAHVSRERMLLYSIINAVADPILLTDVEGKLIVANHRAENLFAAPDEASEGRR